MDQLAEQMAKMFWVNYDPIVRAFGAIEGDEMLWEKLPEKTQKALIVTFRNMIAMDLLRAGQALLRQS
jgi:hypothetical protein